MCHCSMRSLTKAGALQLYSAQLWIGLEPENCHHSGLELRNTAALDFATLHVS